MKDKGKIKSVIIGEQTFIMDDIENKKQYSQVITLQIDTETSRKFYQEEKEKFLQNGRIEWIEIKQAEDDKER
jgi:hypothetical protein